MDNWNYDKAAAFIETILDPGSRRLTKLFLDKVVLYVAQKLGRPESEFDLLFFVTVISQITTNMPLLHRALAGEELDAGWAAVAEELGKP